MGHQCACTRASTHTSETFILVVKLAVFSDAVDASCLAASAASAAALAAEVACDTLLPMSSLADCSEDRSATVLERVR